MSTDRPWWFSGDEPEPQAQPAAEPQQPAEPADGVHADDAPTDHAVAGEDESTPSIAEVIAGVGTLMSWARERVIDPHLSHEDPAEHPDCVICRGMAAVARLAEIAPIDITSIELDDDGDADDEIHWVPLTRTGARDTRKAGPWV